MTPISLACDCGNVVLHIAPRPAPPQGNRIICHCNSCRAFARVLGRTDVLDSADGSDILQIRCDRLSIAKGAEHIAALKLSPKGLARWYAACCNTPLGNTTGGPGFPFFGALVHGIVAKDTLGPVLARVNIPKERPLPQGLPATEGRTTAAFAGVFTIMLSGWLARAQKRNPLFPNGKPLAPPRLVSLAEKETAYA